MDARRISPPLKVEEKMGVLPLDDVKDHLRVRHNDEDRVIQNIILAVYDFFDGPNGWLNGYALLQGEYEAIESVWPCAPGRIELPLRPVLDFSTVHFGAMNASGSYVDLPSTGFVLHSLNDVTCVLRPVGEGYLIAGTRTPSYRARFMAGHADPYDVPDAIKQAMRLLAGHWYKNREASVADTNSGTVSKQIELGMRAAAGRYRLMLDHS